MTPKHLNKRERQIFKNLFVDALEPTAADVKQIELIASMTDQAETLKAQVETDGLLRNAKDMHGNDTKKQHQLLLVLQKTQATLAAQLSKWNDYQLKKEKALFDRYLREELENTEDE